MKRLPVQTFLLPIALLLSSIAFLLSNPPQAYAQAQLCYDLPPPPEFCEANQDPGERTPSCSYALLIDTLLCFGNNYRACDTDPRIPAPTPGQTNRNFWFPASDFPTGQILYNGKYFPVPAGGVHVCDANTGNCENPACKEGAEIPVTPIACTAPSSGAQDSRPDVCDACNATGLLTPACATAPTVSTTVRWQRWEPGPENLCTDGRAYVIRDWGGTITLDGSDTTIPFVGAKGLESEERYITDYFEGTALYYRQIAPQEPTYKEFTGVYRKLSPRVIQDRLRQDMVRRAILGPSGIIPNAIHDYLVDSGVYRRNLTEFDGHFPPDPGQDFNAYNAWQASEWGQLWPYVPMFTREDTPGNIIPYLGARINDTFTILQIEDPPEQLPHVARMFELSTQIQNTLLPEGM